MREREIALVERAKEGGRYSDKVIIVHGPYILTKESVWVCVWGGVGDNERISWSVTRVCVCVCVY